MRRKSERTASKKAKPSPEKKVEKVKRTRSRRSKKQSSSSENETAEESSPLEAVVEAVVETEQKPPTTPVKEASPEESQDQVWQVKSAEGTSDGGEIKKLKICLTRPPSTPERVDRSPRSKRKLSRATSSSDTPSLEAGEDKKKSKKNKRQHRESNESDKNQDNQGDGEPEAEAEIQPDNKSDNEISQSSESKVNPVSDETPMSTTNEEKKSDETEKPADSTESQEDSQQDESNVESGTQEKTDADTTVASPKNDTQDNQTEVNTSVKSPTAEKEIPEPECKTPDHEKARENESPVQENKRLVRERSESVEKSEVLELHAEESKCESTELESHMAKEGNTKDEELDKSRHAEKAPSDMEVSISEEKSDNSVSEKAESAKTNSNNASINKPDVVESSTKLDKVRKRNTSTDSDKDRDIEDTSERFRVKEVNRSDSVQSAQEEPMHNGQAAPIVVSRKRRWGSRPSKIMTEKSITISTDILKEIIPDVKPVEFNEVIEEKKSHKRVEVTEKVERPLLPKIVIDNTENVEQHRKEVEDKDNKENAKVREPLGINRKISIVKDDDSILTRPLSPPKHKKSNILYITNLVRPFTLPQLKNLLQRTGRIAENGFWIDRIKSKCFVKYENEDQAVETRHALHGVTWPVSNPKTLQVDFSSQEAFDKAKLNEDVDNAKTSNIPGTVEDWLREQDLKRERGELEKPWERKAAAMREWDVGKNEKDKEKDGMLVRRDERPLEKRRQRTSERSPEPAKKFKKKEEEAPAKLLDDLFRKTKTTPCIYWLPLSAETIAIKEEQRRQHMAEHERRLLELRRTQHRRH